MNNLDRACELVDKYVSEHGRTTEMERNDFINWVHQTYDRITVEKKNLYPTDISFNLYNAGLKEFPKDNLCLLYIAERDTFRLVGSDFIAHGPVIQYVKTKKERIVGNWNNGSFAFTSQIF